MQKRFFPEDAEEIIKLWNGGATASYLAEQFGTTKNSIVGFISRHRLKEENTRKGVIRERVFKRSIDPPPKKKKVTVSEKRAVFMPRGTAMPPPKEGYWIWDLGPNQCRYAITHHAERHHAFCGKEVYSKDFRYCLEHCKIIYPHRF